MCYLFFLAPDVVKVAKHLVSIVDCVAWNGVGVVLVIDWEGYATLHYAVFGIYRLYPYDGGLINSLHVSELCLLFLNFPQNYSFISNLIGGA